MKKVAAIIVCIVCLACLQSKAQTITTKDSLNNQLEKKRIADSTETALRKTTFEKRKDSIAEIVEQRQQDRIERQDSIREARMKQRKNELQNKRDYINRKKEREQIRDSVAQESKKAAAARKAYRKSLKKKGKATKKKVPVSKTPPLNTKKKKEKEIKEPKKKVVKKKEKTIIVKEKKTKKEPEKKVEKKTESKEIEKKDTKANKQKAKEIAKQKKANADSIRKAEKNEDRLKNKEEKGKTIVVSQDQYEGGNYFITERYLEPPEKKKTYFSFQIGASNYLGDLGGNSRLEDNLFGDVNFRDNTFFYGFSLSHLRREAIGLRLSYVFGTIAGSDKNTFFKSELDPSYTRYVRNLDFKSKINEGSLMLELHPFKFLSYKSSFHQSYLQPYFLIGIGTYSFNPQGSYYDPILDDNVWVDLQPLGTEGQGSAQHPDRQPYKLSQWNIPYGVGFNYEISRTINLGLEFVGRKLFTDYLDDVSTTYVDPAIFDQNLTPENAELAKILNNKSKLVDAGRAYNVGDGRGNSNNNDLYFSISARLSIKLNRNRIEKSNTDFSKKFYRYDDNEICE